MNSLLNLIVLFKNGTYHNNYKISYYFWVNIYKSKLDLKLKKDYYFLNILKNNGYILGFNYQVNKTNKEELIDLKYLSKNKLKNKINTIENMFLQYQLKNIEIKQKVNNNTNFKLVSNNFYKTITSQIGVRFTLNSFIKILFNIPHNRLLRPYSPKIEGTVTARVLPYYESIRRKLAKEGIVYMKKNMTKKDKDRLMGIKVRSKRKYRKYRKCRSTDSTDSTLDSIESNTKLESNSISKYIPKSKSNFNSNFKVVEVGGKIFKFRTLKRKRKKPITNYRRMKNLRLRVLRTILYLREKSKYAMYFPMSLDKYLYLQKNKWSYLKKNYKANINLKTQKSNLFSKDKKILQKYKLTILLKNLYSRNSIIENVYFISKPGHKVYIKVNNLRKIISHKLNYLNNNSKSKKNLGLIILNTSLGLLSHTQAIKNNVGGELICIIK